MAQYPREINLSESEEDALKQYIRKELVNHYAERGPHIDDLLRWQKDYWAKAPQEVATFPFKNAATIIIPLSAIAVEAIHARTMTTLFGQAQLVSAHAIDSAWDGATRDVERFLDRELLDVMKIQRPMGDAFLEGAKFGTMIGKTTYEKIVKSGIKNNGGVESKFDVVIRDGAEFNAVPDARFLMPYSANDPQSAPWCGEEHEASWYEIEMMERGGLFKKGTILNGEDGSLPGSDQKDTQAVGMRYSKLQAFFRSGTGGTMGDEGGRKFENNQNELEHTTATLPLTIDWVELWMSYDVDGDGETEEIVVHYHRGANVIMSCRYNWNADLSRPYDVDVYFPLEHRWRGIGVCKQNEQFQKEITTQHRQRLDNATLANMRMIKISKMAGYGPGEPVFPGKMWFVDDMTHIDTVQMGEIYPSAYNNEQATLQYSQQRTGITEVTMGMPQVGTPGTATAELSRVQEGKAKFDFIYANERRFASNAINRIATNIQMFGPRNIMYFEHADNGQLVKQFFDMPAVFIRDGLLITLKASGQQQNKILDRQNWQQVAQLLQQYYQSLIQIAQGMQNQQLMMGIFTRALSASTEAMRQILDTYDVKNIDRLIVKELDQVLVQGGPQGIMPAQLGNGNGPNQPSSSGNGSGVQAGPPGISGNAPMDIFSAAIQGPGTNSNGQPNRVPVGGASV